MNPQRVLLVSEQQRLLDALIEGCRIQWPLAEVASATDFETVVNVASHPLPDLVVVDLSSVQPNRWCLIRALRSVLAAPIVVFASDGDILDKARGAEVSASVYSRRPFSARSLLKFSDQVYQHALATPVLNRHAALGPALGSAVRQQTGSHTTRRRMPASLAAAALITLTLLILLTFAQVPGLARVRTDVLCSMAPDDVQDDLEYIGWCPSDDVDVEVVSKPRLS